MLIMRKTAPRHYELVCVLRDGSEKLLSKLFPSDTNKSRYVGLCVGHYWKFKTVREWVDWCTSIYGEGVKHEGN